MESAKVCYHFYKVLMLIAEPPSRLKIVERAKHDAWKKLGNTLTKDEAKTKFIEKVKAKVKDFPPKL